MQETRVLLVFPGSLFGGRWADGPRVKPELVQLFTELRRAGYDADVLDLEAELRQPGRRRRPRELPADRRRPAGRARGGPGRRLLLVRPAVLGRRRRRRARAPAAAGRRDRRLRPPRLGAPGRLQRPGRALRLAHRRRGGDGRARRSRRRSRPASARRAAATRSRARRCRSTPAHLPDYAAYPYTAEGLPELGLFLSRGCPYNAPACLLRPGGARLARLPAGRRRGGHRRRRRPAPGRVAGPRPGLRLRGRLAARRARPAGGRRPARPRAQRHRPPRRPAAPGRRQALQGAGRPRARGGHALAGAARRAPARRRTRRRPSRTPLELLRVRERQGRRHARPRSSSTSRARREESAAETLDALERFVARRAQHVGHHRRAAVGVPARSARRGPTSTPRRRASARASRTPSGGRSAPTRTPPPRRSWRATSSPAARPATRATGGRASRSCARRWPPSSRPTRAGACAATRRWARAPTACPTAGGRSRAGTDGAPFVRAVGIAYTFSAGAVLGSSMVEHSAVNRRVVGSSPTRGASHQRGAAVHGPRRPFCLWSSRERHGTRGPRPRRRDGRHHRRLASRPAPRRRASAERRADELRDEVERAARSGWSRSPAPCTRAAGLRTSAARATACWGSPAGASCSCPSPASCVSVPRVRVTGARVEDRRRDAAAARIATAWC